MHAPCWPYILDQRLQLAQRISEILLRRWLAAVQQAVGNLVALQHC